MKSAILGMGLFIIAGLSVDTLFRVMHVSALIFVGIDIVFTGFNLFDSSGGIELKSEQFAVSVVSAHSEYGIIDRG